MGQFPQYQSPYPVYQQRTASGFGIASLILGIIALLGCWVPVAGFLFAGLGLVLAFVGLCQNSQTTAKGTAVAGGIISVVALVPTLIYVLIIGGAAASKAANTAAAARQRSAVTMPATTQAATSQLSHHE